MTAQAPSDGWAVNTGGVVFAAWTQPEDGLHESIVQQFPSSQFVGPPELQTPPLQVSPVVQALPSLHAVPFGAAGFEHMPVPGLQTPATWH
jgi:hypothetical protein